MSRYLIDTNAFIAVLRKGSRSPVAARLRAHAGVLSTSSLVAQELYRGAYRSADVVANLESVEDLLAVAPPIDFSREDARIAGRIDAELWSQGSRIGPFDTLIAAQVLARNLILVTHNTDEFGRIDGIRIEDWDV